MCLGLRVYRSLIKKTWDLFKVHYVNPGVKGLGFPNQVKLSESWCWDPFMFPTEVQPRITAIQRPLHLQGLGCWVNLKPQTLSLLCTCCVGLEASGVSLPGSRRGSGFRV